VATTIRADRTLERREIRAATVRKRYDGDVRDTASLRSRLGLVRCPEILSLPRTTDDSPR
jgi:hypothetical protein